MSEFKTTQQLEKDVIDAALAWSEAEHLPARGERLRVAAYRLKARRQVQATLPRAKSRKR